MPDGNRVTAPERGGTPRAEHPDTAAEDRRLCGRVFGHIAVPIEVVFGDIGNGAPSAWRRGVHQLKAGKLNDKRIGRAHLANARKQGRSDIAPEVGPAPCGRKDRGAHHGGGGLAVAPRYRENIGRGEGKQKRRLGQNDSARAPRLGKRGMVGAKRGGAKDNTAHRLIKIPLRKGGMTPERRKARLCGGIGQSAVTHRKAAHPDRGQKIKQRQVGNPKPRDHRALVA